MSNWILFACSSKLWCSTFALQRVSIDMSSLNLESAMESNNFTSEVKILCSGELKSPEKGTSSADG